MSQTRVATATGLATYCGDAMLDVWYPQPVLGEKAAHVAGLERGIDTDALAGSSSRNHHHNLAIGCFAS